MSSNDLQRQRVLVIGSGGQLGQALTQRLHGQCAELIPMGRDTLDITDAVSVSRAFQNAKPDVVFNAAAFTDVERAESQPEAAFLVNQQAVIHLRDACISSNCKLVHFGSDYVFDGSQRRPYRECDEPNPLNEYGKSKLAGDLALLESESSNWLLFRSSWVFGHGPNNFFHKLLAWATNRESLEVVYDQIATPTYAADLADAAIEAVDRKLTGLFHCVNRGYASRYEVARELFRQLEREIVVVPVASSRYPSPVVRPFFSALNNAKLEQELGRPMPTWEEALSRYLIEAGLKS